MAKLFTPTALRQTSERHGRRANGADVSAEVAVAVVSYTLTGDEAAADVLNLVELPPGAQVLPHLSRIDFGATGLTGVTVGDSADADRYLGSTSFATAGGAALGGAASLAPHTITEETGMVLATIGGGTAAADTVIVARIAYRLHN